MPKPWNHSRLCTAVLLLVVATCTISAAAETGTISGRVVDAKGNGIANAAVFVCDQESGMPLGSNVRDVLTYKRLHGQEEQPLWVKTDDEGRFEITDIHAGTCRIFAQKWEADFEDAFKLNGIVVDLLGSADNLKVPSQAAQEVTLKSAGTGEIQFHGRLGNDDAFVFVSTEYPGDAVLGFLGWQAPFGNHVIGLNRMTLGRTTFRGLPEGKVGYTEIELDNRLGLYAGRSQITAKNQTITGKSAEEDMIALWSNARYVPEADLQPVFKHVKKLVQDGRIDEVWNAIVRDTDAEGKLDISKVSDLRNLGNEKNFLLFWELGILERKIELPDDGKATVNEALASLFYLDFERRYADRIARQKQRRQPQITPPDDLPQEEKK